MIKFRQKEYSGLGTKILHSVKKAANRIDTSIANRSLKVQDKLGTDKLFLADKNPLKRKSGRKIKISPKTNRQIHRETVESREAAKKIYKAPMNENIDDGLKFASGNPIAAISGSYPAPGSALAGKSVDSATKFFIPPYEKATRKLQSKYAGSKFSKSLRNRRLPSLEEIGYAL